MDEGPLEPPPGENVAADIPPPPEIPQPQGAPRNLILVVTAVVVVAVIVVAAIGYGVVGYAFASSRIAGARSAYNNVVSHQNTITESFNTLDTKMTALSLTTATTADLQQNRTAYAQLVSQSQSAQATLVADDASLKSDMNAKRSATRKRSRGTWFSSAPSTRLSMTRSSTWTP
ncbi:MAG: hypothetical protein AUH32_02920 [Actinobacteria bacterium 13_1_40CM_66_12]|nr:MAG: hypothetical protein AUH32_02920 [Actinobacteria bacterium 13_1_40CM_66_12]